MIGHWTPTVCGPKDILYHTYISLAALKLFAFLQLPASERIFSATGVVYYVRSSLENQYFKIDDF